MMEFSMPVQINSDENGCFDRMCPECGATFKVNLSDWEEKFHDEAVYCPQCRYTAAATEWNTDEQNEEYLKRATVLLSGYFQKELSKSSQDMERSTKNNRFLKIKFTPWKAVTFSNNPIGSKPEWAINIICEDCGARYGVIGNVLCCPCCGSDADDKVFIESLDSIEKMISSIDEIKGIYIDLYGKPKAETMCESMVSNSLGDIVSAFQRFAYKRFKYLFQYQVKPNDFQIVKKGSDLFKNQTGYGYEAWLSNDELNMMKIMFQRRHVIEHNGGRVDEKYLSESGDTAYIVSQKLKIDGRDIMDLLVIIKKLSQGLIKIRQ